MPQPHTEDFKCMDCDFRTESPMTMLNHSKDKHPERWYDLTKKVFPTTDEDKANEPTG